MAVQMKVTRRLAGHADDGTPVYHTTTYGPRPPESAGEWREQRIARLGDVRRNPAGLVVVALLQADGDAAVRAAVAAGRDLDEWQRWGVLRTLRVCASAAGRFGHAVTDPLLAEWVSAWGEKDPRDGVA